MIRKTANNLKKQTLFFLNKVYSLCSPLRGFSLVLWFLYISSTVNSQENTLTNRGPGGVNESNSNVLWLRASDISGVADGMPLNVVWQDTSGNNHDAFQGSVLNQPVYLSGGLNGRAAIQFDGIASYLENVYSYNAQTVFIVYSVNPGLQNDGQLGQLWGNYGDGVHVAADPRSMNLNGFSFDGTPQDVTRARYAINGSPYGLYVSNDNYETWTEGNVELVAVEFETRQSLTNQVMGSLAPHMSVGDHQFGGEIAEVIVYDTVLNAAQRIIVENYLSSYYNIDISSAGHDFYSFEYTHPYDVAGIGRADIDNIHSRAYSAGVLGISDADNLDSDGEYFLYGHDNAGLDGWSESGLADTVLNTLRIEREWRVERTGDPGLVTISIDTTLLSARPEGYGMYVLLVDDDGDFSSGAKVYEMQSPDNDSIFQVENIELISGAYISVGIVKPTLQFVEPVARGFENENADVSFYVNYIPSSDITVDYFTTDGTAISPDDFLPVDPAVTVTLLAGNTLGTVSVDIIDDAIIEPDKRFLITLTNPSPGIMLGDNSALFYTIMDDDHDRKIYFSSATSAGLENGGTFQIDVQITPSEFDEVNSTTVDYEVTGGTATGGGEDYILAAGTVSIPPYNTAGSFTINIIDDALAEDDETVVITLMNPGNSSLSPAEPVVHTFTIIDNDTDPFVQFSISGKDVDESAGSVSAPVILSAISGKDITVNYTVSGTTDSEDHDLSDGTLIIPAGTLSATIDFAITDDQVIEPTETLIITLQEPSINGRLGVSSSFTVTITDNDAGMGYTGPGGVGDSLINKLWLAASFISGLADGEDLVTAWRDSSGNNHHSSQSDAAYLPSFHENVINGLPVVRFNGASENDYLDDDHSYNARTVFAVYRVDPLLQDGNELGQIWGNYDEGVHVALDPRSGSNNRGWSFDGDGDENTSARYSLSGAPYGMFVENDNATQWSFDEFQLVSVEFETTGALTRQVIGSLVPRFNVGEHHFGGELAELIVYNTSVNNTQRILIENYLAVKYNLNLAVGINRYTYGATHSQDVAGIGKLSVSDYHLKARSSGILTIDGASNLDNNDFLLFGHNGGGIDIWTDVGVPADSLRRIGREWMFDETGETGEIHISVDTSKLGDLPNAHDGFFLMLTDDGDFTAGVTLVPLTLNEGRYSAAIADINDGMSLAIATVAPVISFSRSSSAASEAAGTATIAVSLSAAMETDVEVDFVISGGTATEGPGNDYTVSTSPLLIPAGSVSENIIVTINEDDIIEIEESIVLELTGVNAGVALGPTQQHTFIISDNDNDGYTGPGGVGDSSINKLWLKADFLVLNDSEPVLTWPDFSGNQNDAINMTPGQEPQFIVNGLDNLPVVRFDDSKSTYLGNNKSLGISGFSNATVFIVARNTTPGDEDNTGLFIGQSSGTGATIRHYGLEYEGTIRFNNGNRIFLNGFSRDNWRLGTWRNTAGARYGEYEFFLDGTAQTQTNSVNPTYVPNTSDDLFLIGAGISGTADFSSTRFFNGDMAEVIAYAYELNEAQRIIVENYLAAKYHGEISISEDYYNYDSQYGSDVAGIGRVDPASYHTTAQSGGMIRFSNATDLDDDEWMFFGHNGGDINHWEQVGAPGDSVRILPRTWRIDETGNPGDYTIQLDSSLLPPKPAGYNTYSLWLDDDGDFTNGAQQVPLTKNSGIYEATGVDVTGGQYLAISLFRPVIGFSQRASAGDEADSPALVQVSLNYVLEYDVSIDYDVVTLSSTADGSGNDYILPSGTLTIPAGSLTSEIEIIIIDDTEPETDETIEIVLFNPMSGITPGEDSLHTYTIYDNDNLRDVEFAIGSSSGSEEESPVSITVRLSDPDPLNPTSVDFAVTGGTAINGIDYSLVAGTVTIPPNQWSSTIQMDVIDDLLNETNETVIITLENPVNANLGPIRTHTYTILDNDPLPEVAFLTNRSNVSEDLTPALLPVGLSNISGLEITVDYAVTGGTATGGGVDYTLNDGTLVIPAGDSIAFISIDVIDDLLIETEETIELILTNVNSNGLPGAQSTHTITINNNDFIGFTGPGGVGNKEINRLWLRADTLVTLNSTDIITWGDFSGNNHDAINLSFGQEPEIVLNELNGKPVIRFDDHGGTNGDYLGSNISLGISGAGPATVFMVANNRTAADEDNTGFFIGDAASAGGNIRHYGLEHAFAIRFNNGNRIFDNGFTQNDWKIGVIRNSSGAQYFQYEAFLDGAIAAQIGSSGPTSVPSTIDNLYYVGAGRVSSDFRDTRYFGGDMAEIIVFNTDINETQRNIIENYLSSKYGIAVVQDYYAYDAVHGNDVAGIGMIAANDFHIAAQSAGLIKVYNPNDLSPGDFLLFGHDGSSTSSWSAAEVPGTGLERIDREWRVDLTGNPGIVNIALDTTLLADPKPGFLNYVLLVDSDGNFSSGADIIPLTLADGEYVATGVALNMGDYLSIGVVRPEVQFSQTSFNQSEGITNVSIAVEMNFPSDKDLNVNFAVIGGSATGGGIDYSLADGTLLIEAGTTDAAIQFLLVDDFMVEPDETILLELSDPSFGFTGPNTIHTFTINDNDNSRTVNFALPSGSGNEDVSPLSVEVQLSAAHPSSDLKVAYRTTGGTAEGGGVDYTLEPDTLVFPAGTTTGIISIDIIDDIIDEYDETIVLELVGTGSLNLNLGSDILYTYTIIDNDDPPEVQFTASGSSGAESFQTVNLNFELSAVTAKDVTFYYSVTGGTATNGADFLLPPANVVLPAGTLTWAEQFWVIDDTEVEPAETIEVSMSGLNNATPGIFQTHVYTILDDDGVGWEGPGGIANSSQNKVWLNSSYATGLSDGDRVTIWTDISGNNNDGKQTGSARPVYLDNPADNWNGKPVVQFDNGYSQYLGIDNTVDLNTGGPYDKRTILVAFRTGIDINTRQVLYEEGGTVRGLNIYLDGGVLYVSGWNEVNDDGGATTPWNFTAVTSPVVPNTPYFTALQFNFTGTDGDVTGWINGDSIDVLAGAGRLFNHPGEIGLGGMNNGSVYHDGPGGGYSHFFKGNISELIINNAVYNSAQKNIVNNYLGAKFNVPISNDYYDHDADYGWGIIGIGQEDLSNSHSIAQGTGFIRIDNPSSLDNGDYLLIGHDNGDVSGWSQTEVPGNDPNYMRIAREWRADDRNNSIGTVRLAVDAFALPALPFGFSKYVLLLNENSDFTSGSEVVELTWSSSLGLYVANNINLSGDKCFTIGIVKPTIQFTETSSGGFESDSPVYLPVSLNYINNSDVTVDFVTSGGTAVAGSDYVYASGSIVIPAGQQTGSLELEIINDTEAEVDETVLVSLRNPHSGHVIGNDSLHTYTVFDDDNLRRIQFTSQESSGLESVANVSLEVHLNLRDDNNETRVAYAVTGGSATGGGMDYTLLNDTLTIAAGDTLGNIIIVVNEDLLNEPDETITVALSGPENANLGDTIQHTYTILDNDVEPEVQFSEISSGGAESFSPVKLRFEISASSGRDITVFYSSSGGTATNGGIDYTIPTPASHVINAGTATDSTAFTVFNDIIEEPDETIIITIDSVWNAQLGADLTFTYTIYDDDGVGWLGPGGVSDDGGYQVWLKSDAITGLTDGDPVSNWEDLTIHGNDATASGGVRPIYYDNPADNINGRPVVDYSGGNYFLELPNGSDFNTGGPYNRKTLIVAFETGADVSSKQVIYEQGAGTRGINIYIDAGLLRLGAWNLANDDGGASTPWGYSEVTSHVGPNEVHYAIIEFNADSSWIKGYVDGGLAGMVTGAGGLFDHGGLIGLGGMNNGSYFHDGSATGEGYYFGGKIAEFLSFNRTLNGAQKVIIENYMGAKYGIPVTNDFYAYESSYDYELFGIGRESSGNSHIISQGSGLIKMDNPSDLNNGEYFFVGHDNGSIDTWQSNDLPLDSVLRVERQWRVGGNGDIGTVRLAFDTAQLGAAPDYYDHFLLLVDTDGDSDFSTGQLRMLKMEERFGEFIRISNLELNEGDVFTIAAARNITVQSGDWSDPDTWLLGVPEEDASGIIMPTHTVALTGNESIGFLTVSPGAELQLGNFTLTITGEGIDNSGVFEAGTGTIHYLSSENQCIAPLTYYNLRISGTGTKTLCGDIIVQNDLELLGFPATLFLDADPVNSYNIRISGDWRTRGTFVPRQGTVFFEGGAMQQLFRDDGAIVNFFNLVASPLTTLEVNHDLVVGGELSMQGGNILMEPYTLTLGINGSETGALDYLSGTVTGKFRRWFAQTADNGREMLFPVGTDSYFRPVLLSFDNLTGSGTLTAQFIDNDPGSSGLPIEESGVTLNQAFPEGYWPVTRAYGFSFAGNYDVRLVADGFSSFNIDTTNRVLARIGSSTDWQLIGDHVNALDTLIRRDNLSGNIYQFGVSTGAACEVTFDQCPADIFINTDPGDCNAVVSWISPVAAATCSGFTVNSTHDPGDTFSVGVTTVTYIASDIYGNADTCEFTVTVTDNELPVISGCPADITITADDEYCGNNVTWTAPTVADNCSATLISTHTPGDFFTVGTTTVTYSAEDGSGNISICSFDVTVLPATPPVISGDTEVCTPVEVTYSVTPEAGMNYLWSVSEGAIVGSDTGTEVTVTWTGTVAGTVEVTATSGSGCSVSNSESITKRAIPLVGDIEYSNALQRR